MAKRRLTEKQKRQISAKKTQLVAEADADTHNGTVITHHGKELIVCNEHGETINCQLRQNLGTIVCGDRVVFQYLDSNSEPKTAVVVACSERDNLLQKTGFGGKAKAVAANIDQVIPIFAAFSCTRSSRAIRFARTTRSTRRSPSFPIER